MPGLDQTPAGDDRDPVADQLDLAQQVRVEQDGDAAAAQLLEQAADDPPADRVEGAGRLVEQQQARAADQRLGDPEPLLHPLRHRLDPLAGGLAELDQVEQLRPLLRAPGRAGEPLVQRPAARRPSTSRGSGRAPPGSRAPPAPAASRRAARAPRRCRRWAGPGRRRSWSGSTCRRRWAPAARPARRPRSRGRPRPAPPAPGSSCAGRKPRAPARHQLGGSIFGKREGIRSTLWPPGREPSSASPRPSSPSAASSVSVLRGRKGTSSSVVTRIPSTRL